MIAPLQIQKCEPLNSLASESNDSFKRFCMAWQTLSDASVNSLTNKQFLASCILLTLLQPYIRRGLFKHTRSPGALHSSVGLHSNHPNNKKLQRISLHSTSYSLDALTTIPRALSLHTRRLKARRMIGKARNSKGNLS